MMSSPRSKWRPASMGHARQHAAFRGYGRLGCADIHRGGPGRGTRGDELVAQPGIDPPELLRHFRRRSCGGRAFTRDDRQGAPNVVIVSEDVAARTWPGEDAIGNRMRLGGANSRDPWREVVGVARRTRYRELREPRATLYLPATQFTFTPDFIVLRTGSPTAAVAALVRDRVRTEVERRSTCANPLASDRALIDTHAPAWRGRFSTVPTWPLLSVR